MNFLLFLLAIALVHADELKGTTEGDQDPWFNTCWKDCFVQLGCANSSTDNQFEKSKSLALTLTFWNCEDECKYVCARKHNQLRLESGLKVVQYYGKWPFIRIYGFQELGSSLFSFGNFLPHLMAVITYSREVPQTYYLRNVILANALLGCFTWTFSTIFHCRDVTITEFLDYSFASLTFFMGSFVATLRIFEMKANTPFYLTCAFFALWLIQHWRYLFFVEFDYGYNMAIGVCHGVYQFFAWALWYLMKARHEPNSEHSHKVVLAFGLMGLAGTMELLDFPPIFEVIDPHALWHLGTIPCFFILWDFYFQDSILEEKKDARKRHHIV